MSEAPLGGDLSAARIETDLERLGAVLGRPTTVVARTSSTNDDAWAAAARGVASGAAFVADAQTSGRGRAGHAWHSPGGENLHLSVLLRLGLPAPAVAPLTLVVGLVCARAVEAHATLRGTALCALVKWPNDIFVSGRKLGGILVEAATRGREPPVLVVGVGINVHGRSFPEPLAPLAASLALEGVVGADRSELAAAVLAGLGEACEAFTARGLEPFREELAVRDALAGRRVVAGDFVGDALGIERDGGLRVRLRSGAVEVVRSGAVRLA